MLQETRLPSHCEGESVSTGVTATVVRRYLDRDRNKKLRKISNRERQIDLLCAFSFSAVKYGVQDNPASERGGLSGTI